LNPLGEGEGEEEVAISIDDAIDRLGFGRFQYQILCATGLSYAADGMQVVLLSFLTPILKEQWGLSNYQTASISSTLFVGAFFGTLLWGPLADSLGRRPVFLMATSVITIASCAMSIISTFGGAVVAVFGIGFGVGGLTIPFDILAEFLPNDQRGQKLLKINYAWTLGVIYVVAGAYLFLNTQHSPSYRLFTRWCSIPCILSLIIGFCLIPESPRWLTAKGRLNEALDILRRAAVTNSSDGSMAIPQQMKLRLESEERQAKLSELLRPQWIGVTLLLWGAWFTFSFGYFGTLMVTTRIFSSENSDTMDTQFDFTAIFVTSFAEFIGTTLAIVMIDRVGRIRAQVQSFLIAGLSLFMLCLSAQSNAQRGILLTLAITSRIFEMTATCILWVATAEILSTEIRGAGHSSSNAFARVGAIFCPLLVQNTSSLIHVGITMCVVHVFTAFCVSRLPETSGRTMGFSYTTRTQT
jgi:MFS family permease